MGEELCWLGRMTPFLVEIVDPGRRSGPQASLLEQGVAMGSQGAVGTEAGMDAATLGNKVPGGLSKLGYASQISAPWLSLEWQWGLNDKWERDGTGLVGAEAEERFAKFWMYHSFCLSGHVHQDLPALLGLEVNMRVAIPCNKDWQVSKDHSGPSSLTM